MQKDMHYYGTYAMARAAGLTPQASETIATCAQFVDDNAASAELKFGNGAWIQSVATAHHTFDRNNLDRKDQRRVWVPFHFLPGNLGDSWTERLKCRMDSPVAREMIEHHLSFSGKPYAAELIGIAAHVYADTFAHYGFSGISSRGNKIANDTLTLMNAEPQMETYILNKLEKFQHSKGAKLQRNFRTVVRGGEDWWTGLKTIIMSWFAETGSGALGHGSVATLPDRPYLEWEFHYERTDGHLQSLNGPSDIHANRPNLDTFLAGCEALHDMFVKFREKRPDLDNNDFRSFDLIRNEVSKVLSVQADKAGRIDAWQRAAIDATVFDGGVKIPEYSGEVWNADWTNLDGAPDSEVVLKKPIWHFYQAAAIHRTYVLRDLLPSHGLIVD